MDQINPESNQVPQEGRFRVGRGPGNREPGGFRIRLSENEIKAARAIQEAFGLRSTVAALGFAIRTIGSMLEEGKLGELIAHQRDQNLHSEVRRERPKISEFRRRDSNSRNENNIRIERSKKPDPFARPAKPTPTSIIDNDSLPSVELGKDSVESFDKQE
uniref:Uncharacterized protein n=1 Tax=Paulinella chromatophora TaxID=39717 RepID=B1X5R7_PAUCH|nr:hypothetical protein PCC_0876 [Paulinella chromatophora]ACB43286.1 hypothetical protein PCC_0876 [Paulinella chromatophora]